MPSKGKCATCDVAFSEKEKLVVCDSCFESVHSTETCTQLAASEYRAVIIQNRSLAYYCMECREAIKRVPKLLIEMSKLKQDLEKLTNDMKNLSSEVELVKQENVELKKEIQSFKSIQTNLVNPEKEEDVIYEVMDRQNRTSNIIVFNINVYKINV
uniref:Uncharacterized protein LOC114347042 isoform X1 n=1 Tax=Diabrotica virgifera virgifera TaxID=50390 RepID=A0A6P7HCQ8_DIAVI